MKILLACIIQNDLYSTEISARLTLILKLFVKILVRALKKSPIDNVLFVKIFFVNNFF